MSTLKRGDTGPDVTRVEIRLNELGLYDSGFDESFGKGVEKGVRAFQQQRGLPVTGQVDDATRAALLAEPSPSFAALKGKSLQTRCVVLTGTFETSTTAPECFGTLAGDFDQQGISFGVLQWNIGQGTLQGLLKQLDARHPGVLKTVFADKFPALQGMLGQQRAAQLQFARSIQSANRVVEPWRGMFKALGQRPECQELQLEDAADRFQRARAMAEEYGLFSERGTALMFDVVVQNGSIKAATKSQILSDFAALPSGLSREQREVEKMRIIARRRAAASNAKADVLSRKQTIAEGAGVVHGLGIDLERQFGIRLVEAA